MDANKLHKESIVLDSHCDTPIRLLDGIDINQLTNDGHVDFPRMKNIIGEALYNPKRINIFHEVA